MQFGALRRQQQDEARQAALDLASTQLNNYAIGVLLEQDKIATAIATLRRAASLNPRDRKVRLSLANTIVREGDLEEAEALIEGEPEDDWRIPFVHAMAAWQRGDLKGARAAFAKADNLNPGGATQRFGQGAMALLEGDWGRGWDLYQQILDGLYLSDLPRWDGKHVDRLLVIADQGIGDIINFARYIPWAAARAEKVIFKVPPPLYRLLHRYGKHCTVSESAEPANAYVALSGLPRLHGTRVDNVPPDPGLLHVDYFPPFPKIPGRKNVGIVWRGNDKYTRNRWRAMPFDLILQLAGNSRLDLYSLQVGPHSRDIADHNAQLLVQDLSGRIAHEWSCSAGALKGLDCLVTVDTGIAHVAGALGAKTYLCLPLMPDWRWLTGRDDTPWYPSVRLVRQEQFGDWRGVIRRIGDMLKE